MGRRVAVGGKSERERVVRGQVVAPGGKHKAYSSHGPARQLSALQLKLKVYLLLRLVSAASGTSSTYVLHLSLC